MVEGPERQKPRGGNGAPGGTSQGCGDPRRLGAGVGAQVLGEPREGRAGRSWSPPCCSVGPWYTVGVQCLFRGCTGDNPGTTLAEASEARVGRGWPPLCADRPLPPLPAPQVLVLELSDEPSDQAVGVASVDLLQDREGFTWKGHERLSPRTGPLPWPAGFQPRALVQCLPPAAVTAVTLHAEWGLVAFGTSHGFGLFDYLRRSPVLARCVRAPPEVCWGAGGGCFRASQEALLVEVRPPGGWARGRPWGSGFPDARHLRPQVHPAPQRLPGHGGAAVPCEVAQEVTAPVLPAHPQKPRLGQEALDCRQQQGGPGGWAAGRGDGGGKTGLPSLVPLKLQEANAQLAEQAGPHDVEVTPVQRRIEPRSADDSLSGVVRCLYFADTFLRDGEAGRGVLGRWPWVVWPGFRSAAWETGVEWRLPEGWKVLPAECWAALATGCPGPQLPLGQPDGGVGERRPERRREPGSWGGVWAAAPRLRWTCVRRPRAVWLEQRTGPGGVGSGCLAKELALYIVRFFFF